MMKIELPTEVEQKIREIAEYYEMSESEIIVRMMIDDLDDEYLTVKCAVSWQRRTEEM